MQKWALMGSGCLAWLFMAILGAKLVALAQVATRYFPRDVVALYLLLGVALLSLVLSAAVIVIGLRQKRLAGWILVSLLGFGGLLCVTGLSPIGTNLDLRLGLVSSGAAVVMFAALLIKAMRERADVLS